MIIWFKFNNKTKVNKVKPQVFNIYQYRQKWCIQNRIINKKCPTAKVYGHTWGCMAVTLSWNSWNSTKERSVAVRPEWGRWTDRL